jgi:hypothetical protein
MFSVSKFEIYNKMFSCRLFSKPCFISFGKTGVNFEIDAYCFSSLPVRKGDFTPGLESKAELGVFGRGEAGSLLGVR